MQKKAQSRIPGASMPTSLERALADPPKCPSCQDVPMERKEIERNELTEGGTVHWVCNRCGLRIIRAFE
jgi:hypothetical protein